MSDLFDVKDRVVIVTGGAGQLGRQFSTALLNLGARVAVFDVAKAHFEACTNQQRSWAVDVTDKTSIAEALREVEHRWGAPHALVNAAAIDSPPDASGLENGPLESYPEASFARVLDVNVKGVLLCCQVVGQSMARAGRGSIINVSSIYGMVSPDQRIYEYRALDGEAFFKPVAYSASKSALFNLTRYVATYFAPKKVRCNTLTLGGVYNGQDQRFLEGYHARVPLGRMAQQDEYNGAVVFLVSDASSYMTGSNLVIDGGWTAW